MLAPCEGTTDILDDVRFWWIIDHKMYNAD